MTRLSFWDWLAYVCLAIVIAYFLLKILRIIQGPVEIDIIALISASYLIGRYAMKIDFISKETRHHSFELKEHSKVLSQISQNCKFCKDNAI